MKKTSIFTILTIVLFILSCKEENPCPENFEAGRITLEDSTRTLFYELTDTLVFKNVDNGSEMRFFANENIWGNTIDIERSLIHPCLQTDFIINVSYNSENFEQLFVAESGDISIYLTGYVNHYVNSNNIMGSPVDDIQFYDYFMSYCSFSNEDLNPCKVEFIAANKGENLNFEIGKVIEELELNQKVYKNVYEATYQIRKYYFNKENGIIGYRDNNALWLLDRIE